MEEFNGQSDIKVVLEQFQSKLYDISARNPFVNVKSEKLWQLNKVDSDLNRAKKIRDKQNFYLKEYGLETTLKIGLLIKWKQPNKDHFFLSPLLYQPAKIIKNQKIELQYKLEVFEDEIWHVNPILSYLFKKHFDFQFDSFYKSIDSLVEVLKEEFRSENNSFIEQNSFTEADSWQLIKMTAIGTFNYKKSVLAKDYESIRQVPNASIKKILGFENYQINPSVNDLLDWFPLDSSQKDVVSYSANNSIVIQGPPGTGKSHTIVATIQHQVALGKKVLFVSEKKSALEVVYNRLGDLKPLAAYFDAEKNTKLSFYQSVKNAYEQAENTQLESELELDESSLIKSQIYPAISRQKKEESLVSIVDLEEELLRNPNELKPNNPQSIVPSYMTWKMHYVDLEKIEKIAIEDWQINSIGESTALYLNKSLFQEQNPLVKIDRKVDELLTDITLIERIQLEYNLDLSWTDFSKICLSASILNMVNRNQIDLLFEETKTYKSFNNLGKKYQILKNQLNAINLKNTAWKKRPAPESIESHKFLLSQTGFFSKFKAQKSHNRIFKNYSQQIPLNSGLEVLKHLLEEYTLRSKLEEIAIKLKHNLSILNPDTEIDFILSLRQKLESASHNHYQQILQHNEHEELVGLLADQHKVIGNVNRVRSFLFNSKTPDSLKDFKTFLLDLKIQLNGYQNSVPELKTILSLPHQLIDFLKLNKYSVSELSKIVVRTELDLALKYQSHLKHLTGNDLLYQLEKFNGLKTKTYNSILKGIYTKQIEEWKVAVKLCSTPHSKLSESEKAEKTHFKKARRVLVHEMNKTRQLMPVKNLFQSTKNLLTKLQPIWILNPLAIAERLPLTADLFDVVIFDESSQIPVEDALPAIYRSKQVIVVGDSQQMPPNRFFSANEQSPSLLIEAEKVLPSKSLLWHYRSEHPDLISFSNQQFYDNELKLLPAWKNYKPILHHYIPDGKFINSTNELEAIAITQRYQDILESSQSDIAIIALSKEQEKCIRQCIAKAKIPLPESVLIRNLESVQGIEKKVVLISIGYARNADDKLNLNFGPINREYGANRLNVLFSRAVEKMEVFTSIAAEDIGLSEIRGLTILRQFLVYTKESQFIPAIRSKNFLTSKIKSLLDESNVKYQFESEQSGLILSCFTDEKRERILLVNPGAYSDSKIDLRSVLAVLKMRFKEIKIIINSDWILDSVKVEKEAIRFLKESV